MTDKLMMIAVALMAAAAGAEEPFAFRARVLDLHPLRLTEDAVPAQADETVVDAGWRIVAAVDDAVVRHAVADIADYFEKSMRVGVRSEVRGQRSEVVEEKTVLVAVDPALKELQSKIDVTAEGIRITGVTAREAMQGCYRLEDEMNFRGRPAVKRGTRTYTRRFSPRMTHSGYELEKFPDAYMDQIAHAGMDAILVFIADPPDVTRNGREDIPALIERARVHGLDVYAYASFHEKAAKMHPLDPGAREYYDSLYGSIVRNAPGLKGLVCVGESVGYPSRDANAGGFWFDPQPGKLMNGFNPFSDWPDWIRLVCDVTRQYKKDFDIIFWTYNWFHLPPEKRLPVVENMPTNVTLLVTWDRGDPPQVKCGAKASVGDYTVTVPGPSQVFESEADVAARRGIKVMTISNTAGRTWDLGAGVPFVPVPWRWQDRYEALRKCNETRGLKALMDSHHYGFTPSFIADFAKVMFTEETDPKDFENVLMALARRDFGDAADAVFSAWKDWSEAFRWHSAEDRDQSGPTRVGPAYPLTRPGIDNPPPVRPYTRKNKKGQSVPTCPWMYMFPRYIMPRHEARIFEPGQLDGEIVWAEREVEYVTAGNGKLRAALDRVSARARENARRLMGIGAYMFASARTLLNVKRYYRAGRRLEAAKDGSSEGVAAFREMLELIEDERKNAEELIPYVEYDSYLGWEATMGYQTNVPALRHKLKLLEDEKRALRALAKTRGFASAF